MFEAIPILLFEKGGIVLCETFIHGLFNMFMYAAVFYFLLTWCFILLNIFTHNTNAEVNSCTQNMDSLRILIIGGQNSGKRSTLESLARHHMTEQFSVCPNLKYVCNDDAYGWKIVAVKCENVRQSDSDESDDIQTFSHTLENILKFLDNFQVIIYCLPFQRVWSNESMEYINVLRSVLGDSILKSHVIFGFTHGDVFEEIKHENGFYRFDYWLNELEPSVLKDALMECENRCVLLNNKTENEETKREQALKTFSMCREIVFNNACLKMGGVHEDQLQSKNEKFVSSENESGFPRQSISRLVKPTLFEPCINGGVGTLDVALCQDSGEALSGVEPNLLSTDFLDDQSDESTFSIHSDTASPQTKGLSSTPHDKSARRLSVLDHLFQGSNIVQQEETCTAMGKSKPLRSEDEQAIRRHWPFLLEELDATHIIWDLISHGVFDVDDKREILGHKSRKKRTEAMLQKLLNAGPGSAYRKFKEVLEKDYSHIVDVLTK